MRAARGSLSVSLARWVALQRVLMMVNSHHQVALSISVRCHRFPHEASARPSDLMADLVCRQVAVIAALATRSLRRPQKPIMAIPIVFNAGVMVGVLRAKYTIPGDFLLRVEL